MENFGTLLQYLTGPIQLVGLVLVVVAGLVPRLTGSRIAEKNQRTLVVGLLALGALVVVGGIGLEAAHRSGQTASAVGHSTAISAGRDVLLGGETSKTESSLERASGIAPESQTPAAPTKQSTTATDHSTAFSAGRDVRSNK